MWSEPVSHNIFYIRFNKSWEIIELCVTLCSNVGRICLKWSLIWNDRYIHNIYIYIYIYILYILLHILLYTDSSKISVFSEAYIYNPVEHLWWSFYCENIHKKCSIVDTCLASKYVSAFTGRLFKRSISLKYFAL